MEKTLQQLVSKLEQAHDGKLVSVVLYGSAAVGDHDARFSDLNILCVLSEITPRELEDSESVFRWWREQGSPAPLLLTEHEVRTCADCFAIEFHDIRRDHRLLYGKDVVSGLEIDDSFYRAQVEHDFAPSSCGCARKRRECCPTPELLKRLLADSVSTFCVLLRHALALHGVEVHMHKRKTVRQGAAAFGFDPEPFDTLPVDLREGKGNPGAVNPRTLFSEYLKQIAVVIAAVDRLDKSTSRPGGCSEKTHENPFDCRWSVGPGPVRVWEPIRFRAKPDRGGLGGDRRGLGQCRHRSATPCRPDSQPGGDGERLRIPGKDRD